MADKDKRKGSENKLLVYKNDDGYYIKHNGQNIPVTDNNGIYITDIDKKYISKNVADSYQNAFNFVKTYYNSDGFKQRLNNAKSIIQRTAIDPKYNMSPTYYDVDFNSRTKTYNAKKNNIIVKPTFDTKNSTSFTNSTKILNINPSDINDAKTDNIVHDYGNAIAHELGHAMDNAIKIIPNKTDFKGDTLQYSSMFPILRDNKSNRKFKEYLKNNNIKNGENNLDLFPEVFYEANHDGSPNESYADLVALREALYRNGVYDSTKKDNPFTKQHLEQWKKLNKPLRLFDNFTDEQIIEMMNTIAYNKSDKSNRFSLEDNYFA